jgi:pantoate--beta-alanine ligase
MIIFKRVSHIQDWIRDRKQDGLSIGFVPTMGALHQGHLSLVELSRQESDITIVSIFVNPKQFNDPQDLIKYPRPLENDIQMLIKCETDVLFLPDVDDIYPPEKTETLNFDPGPLATMMEGKFRPGHFQGVAEVVHRLLSIVEPEKLYMGQKDFQQLTIVRKMITDMKLHVQLVMCPTIREANGLAMSSRNVRLSANAREKGRIIYDTLSEAERDFEEGVPAAEIKEKSMETLNSAGFIPEYFEIVDGLNLAPIETIRDSQFVVACCAVKVEDVRLIDNLIWTDN